MAKTIGAKTVGVGHRDFAWNGVRGSKPHGPTRRTAHVLDLMIAQADQFAHEGCHHAIAIFRGKQPFHTRDQIGREDESLTVQ